jgi:hypothetical protein
MEQKPNPTQTEEKPEIEMQYFKLEEKEKWGKYVGDEKYIVIEDEEEGTALVTRRFTDEDWDEMDEYMDKHPMFFNNLSEEDLETNEYLQALQAIVHNEDAETLMERFYVRFEILFLGRLRRIST